MSRPLDRFSRLVTARPYITIIVLPAVTSCWPQGATRRLPPVEGASVAFLPPGSAIATAVEELDEFFGESGDVSVVTLVFRGEALTPEGSPRWTPSSTASWPARAWRSCWHRPIRSSRPHGDRGPGRVDAASATQAEIDSVLSVP